MGTKKRKAGRPRITGRTRFDAMVDLDLKQKANAARLGQENPDSWPELVERLMRFLEGGVSTHDLTTSLELVLGDLELHLKSKYQGAKLKGNLAPYEPIRQLIKKAKWLEHNRR